MTLTTPNSRQERYAAFQEFMDSATARFEALCEHNLAAKRFDDIYTLCISPGGRLGGRNPREFEVFFGARPYDKLEGIDSSLRPSIKLLSERGATLEFVRDDLGRVHVTLYPATSEGMKSLEDALELGAIDNPVELAEDSVLSRYFCWLVAYMQCTCLDGLPTLRDRFTVAKFRFLHRRVVDGRTCDARVSTAAREVAKWALTVGFSGALLAAVQWAFSRGEPTVVRVSAEPPRAQQQRADLVSLGKESAGRLEAVERHLRDIRARLDAPLIAQPVSQPHPKGVMANEVSRQTDK